MKSGYRRKGRRRPWHGRRRCGEAGAEEPRLSRFPAAGRGEVALASGSVSNGRLSSAAGELARCRQPSQQLRPFLPFNTLPIASAALGTLLCRGVCVYAAPCFVVCVRGEPRKVISGPMQKGFFLGRCFICRSSESGRLQTGDFTFGFLPLQQILSGPWAISVGSSKVYFKKQNNKKALLHIRFTM